MTTSATTKTIAILALALVAIHLTGAPRRANVLAGEAAPDIERLDQEGARALAQIYEYEPSIPLEARIVEKAEKDGLEREKIVFQGVQGFLVPAYLQLPRQPAGPCGCVLLLHGWSGSKNNWWEDGNYISGGDVRRQLLAAGFAVMALDAQCHGDRIAQNDFAPVNHFRDPNLGDNQRKGYFTQQDIYIQTTRDYRRAIDYLLTRSEIDSKRIGVIGYSMGGTQTFLLTGVEPRIKAAVAVAAPAEKSKWSPIAPQNFAGGIGARPFLTILGRTDTMCSVEHAQALQTLLPRESSDQEFFDAGHKLPRDYAPRAVEWIKKHL
ncbi:MAG TPA: alpha/beta fold hydrolase [Pirellulales bacterium]|jgi:dienelactone hydrolase|nr:alpha/beta fold hydrolase [Pirellulales bacterium]